MSRFLGLSFAILFSTLLGVFFIGSSASAASPWDNLSTTDDDTVYDINNDTPHENLMTDYYSLWETNTSQTCVDNRASFQRALNTGAWSISIYEESGSDKPNMFNLVWHETRKDMQTFRYFVTAPNDYPILGAERGSQPYPPQGSMRLYWYNDKLYVECNNTSATAYSSFQAQDNTNPNISTKLWLLLTTYELDYPQGYNGQILPDNFSETVTIPIFAASSPSWSDKPNHAKVISQIDQTRWNIETDNLKQPVVDFKLWKKSDVPSNMFLGNEVNGTDALTGTGWNVWEDVPFGEYRLVAAGIGWPYDPDIQDTYNVKSTVLDIEVDEDGFYYSWVDSENKYCFYSQNNTAGSLWGLDTDPNTGSWVSPGTNPIRCQDVQQPGDTETDSPFNKSYNFDELEQCDTLDVACHISRFFNAITSWVMQTIYNLLIPKPAFWGQLINSFDSLILDKLGFIGYPLSWVLNTLNGMIDAAVQTKCQINFGQFGGGWLGSSQVSANFCVIQQNHSVMWQTIVTPIRLVFGALFIFTAYRAWRNFMEGR